MRPIVIDVPAELMRRCRAFGQQTVDSYNAGQNEHSRALACNNVDQSVEVQTMGRIAEVALCLWADLEPLTALNWSRYCDGGHDLVLRGLRFDVKASHNGSQFLIWPITKNHLFAEKQFDALAFARVHESRCELVGWTTKLIFRLEHGVAGEGHRLFPGTWFMHESQLQAFGLHGALAC